MKNIAGYALVFLAVFGYQYFTSADRDESGAIIDAGTVDAFSIKVGDCFDDVSATENISTIPAVPCGDPHDNETYAVFDVSVSSYPGRDEMETMAMESCLERFEGFVGVNYQESSLDIFPMFPSTESWAQNDREDIQ